MDDHTGVETKRVAQRLADNLCPIESCTGALSRRHPTVPWFYIGCDGPEPHLFEKVDLFDLKVRPIASTV